MSKKKLFVCGDSFMSPILNNKNPKLKHFVEILAEKCNFTLVRLSQGGSSNGGICIQLETALKYKSDIIITNTTLFDRIEFPFGLSVDQDRNVLSEPFLIGDMYHVNIEAIQKETNIKHNPLLVSNSFDSIINNNSLNSHQYWKYNHHLSAFEQKDKIDALKKYVKHLYHPPWKKQTDIYMIYAMLHKIKESGIPFILTLDILNLQNQEHKINWLEEKNLCNLEKWHDKSRLMPREKDPGYHTYPELHPEAAEILYQHVKTHYPNLL